MYLQTTKNEHAINHTWVFVVFGVALFLTLVNTTLILLTLNKFIDYYCPKVVLDELRRPSGGPKSYAINLEVVCMDEGVSENDSRRIVDPGSMLDSSRDTSSREVSIDLDEFKKPSDGADLQS